MSFSRCWQRFGTILTLDPGVREAWHQGRRWYHVWVLKLEDPLVDHRMAEVRAALEDLIVPSAPGQPHVTAWVQGFEAGKSHPRRGETVEIRVGGANSFLSCPILEVRCPELIAIRHDFIGSEERWAPFLPHLTLGRYEKRVPVSEVKRRLHPFRGMPPLRTCGTLIPVRVDAFSEEGRFEEEGDRQAEEV